MKAISENNIQELVSEAIRFSSGIDKYARLLGLNVRDVAILKNDLELLQFIMGHENSYTESFISYNMVSVQWRLTELIAACANSQNFSDEIGDDLGIKIPLHNTSGLNSNMQLKWGMDMSDPQAFLY